MECCSSTCFSLISMWIARGGEGDSRATSLQNEISGRNRSAQPQKVGTSCKGWHVGRAAPKGWHVRFQEKGWHVATGWHVKKVGTSPTCQPAPPKPRVMPARFPRTPRSAGVLLAFCRRSAPILAFWRSRFGVLPPGVLPWRSGGAWRSGSGVLVPWRSGSGVLGCLAFWVWRSGLPGVLLGVLPWRSGGWRSAGVLAFCLAFCRRSGVLPGVLVFCLAFCSA